MKQFLAVFFMGFKYLWRNPLTVSVIICFPIVFILILGNALSSYITPVLDFEPLHIMYVTDNEESMFAEFLKTEDISRFLDIEITDEAQAVQSVTDNDICVAIFEKNGEISIIKSSVSSVGTSVVLAVIDSYIQVSAAAEIAIANGANPFEVFRAINSEFAVDAVPLGNRVPNAMDYYAVTMLVYIMLLAGMNGLELFNKSLISDTGRRIMTAPVSKSTLICGLVAASTLTSFLQGMITFVFTALVYGVYWGERIPLVLVTLFAVVLLSQALCIFLILLFNNPGPPVAIIQATFFITTFVSGGYAKISFGGAADKVLAYAPNALAHTVIFGAIFGGNEGRMMFSLALLFALAIVFFVLAFFVGRRKLA
ncbi:MAG: ABC transporter permease [Oscillospiraceae bacterium]|nr:ABC transporter permease [Oscillospiraceae bacterium]